MKNKIKKTVLKGTILSILIFFSISFITVLVQLNSPFNQIEGIYQLSIGFPFVYYFEFMIAYPIPNSGWTVNYLILDCFLTWITTILIMIITKQE